MITKASITFMLKRVFSLHTILLLAGTYILLPERIFSFPHNGLDPSWMIALNMAVEQNMVFGRDFIYTFGPLGFLYTGLPVYIPKIVILLFQTMIFWSIAFILNFYLQQIKTIMAKSGFIIFMLVIYIELFPEKAFLLLLIFMFFLLYHLNLQKRFALIFAGFVALLTFFVKLNTGLLLTFLLFPYLLFAGYLKIEQWKFIAAFSLLYFALLLFFSSLLNVDVLAYTSNAFDIINHYSDAVNIPPTPMMLLIAAAIIMAYGLVLLLNFRNILENKIRIFSIIYVSLAFFVLFKEGFVRADGHMMLFFGKIVPLISFLYFFETNKRFRSHLKYCILFTGFMTIASTQVFYSFNYPLARARQIITKVAYRDVILGEYEKQRIAMFEHHKKFAKIPDRIIDRINDKSVDIIPTDISYIYFNDLNYSPRPSMQSYASYSGRLDGINAKKYASDNAPDFIMYAIGSIDNRHPFWDESKTKMVMLANYQVIDTFGIASDALKLGVNEDFILLEKRKRPLKIMEIESKSFPYHLGDKLNILKSDNLIYLEIDFKYTFIGKMMRLFFQPNRLIVEMWYDGFDESFENVAIKPILANGVLINKKITTLEEATDFFRSHGNDNPDTRSIRFAPKYGYSIGLKEDLEITLKAFRIE
jgi:hypothetical protein